jgi:hypothetical protein
LSVSTSIVSKLTLPGFCLINANRLGGLAFVGFDVALVVVLSDHRFEPCHRLRTQPRRHPLRQGLLAGSQRRAHDPVDAGLRRWLDLLVAAMRQQFDQDLVGPTFLLANSGCKPLGELLGIGDAALAEPEVLADLSAVIGDRAASPLVETQIGGSDLNLAGDELDHLVEQVCTTAGEPAMLPVEPKKQRETQSRRPTLPGDQSPLTVQQRPMLNQILDIERSQSHTRGSSSPPATDTRRRLDLGTAFLPAPQVRPGVGRPAFRTSHLAVDCGPQQARRDEWLPAGADLLGLDAERVDDVFLLCLAVGKQTFRVDDGTPHDGMPDRTTVPAEPGIALREVTSGGTSLRPRHPGRCPRAPPQRDAVPRPCRRLFVVCVADVPKQGDPSLLVQNSQGSVVPTPGVHHAVGGNVVRKASGDQELAQFARDRPVVQLDATDQF